MIGQLQKKLSFLLSAVSICFLLLILLFLFFYNRNSLYMGMKNALTNAMAQPMDVPTSGSYPIFQLVIREDGEIEDRTGQDYFLDADIKKKLIQKALKQVKSEKGSFFSSVEGGSFPYYCKRSTEPQEEREESEEDSVGEGKDRDFSKEEAKEEARYRLVITDFRKESMSIRRLLGVLGMLFVVLSGGIALFARFFVGKTLIPVKESLEAQRQFVADASHELKTPLTVILNDVENLDYHLNRLRKEEKEKTDPSDRMEWTELQKMEGAVRGIQEMSRRMKYLTESLLDLSRLERWQDRKNQFAILSFTHLVEMECLLFEPLFFDQKRTLTSANRNGGLHGKKREGYPVANIQCYGERVSQRGIGEALAPIFPNGRSKNGQRVRTGALHSKGNCKNASGGDQRRGQWKKDNLYGAAFLCEVEMFSSLFTPVKNRMQPRRQNPHPTIR